MKNKRSLLIFGLIALMLVLGVGYAAVTGVDLTIAGTASVEDSTLKVSFKSVSDDSDADTTVTNTVKDGDLADTFTISNMTLNETVTLTYTVQNQEADVAAVLSEKTALTNSNPEHFEATYRIIDPNVAANGGTTTVEVTVKLTKTPVVEEDNEAEFELVLAAAPAQN